MGTGFNPGKRCLLGTRIAFIDTITKWVNNQDPSSPKVLLLFGQAGTGKSSIVHEIAHIFNREKLLTTSYCFVHGQPSSRESYRFFTTLASDLCNKYPAFKISLGNIISNNRALVNAQDYTTLFESLLINPLSNVRFVDPMVIVMDALDESEDVSKKVHVLMA